MSSSLLGLVEALDRELVEAAVVHTARVRDEPDLDLVASPASVVVAAATRSADGEEQRRDDDQNHVHRLVLTQVLL